MKIYRHSPIAHLLGCGFPISMCWLAYRVGVAPIFLGSVAERIAFVAGCILLALFVSWLYWKSALNRYQVMDEGLVVSRLRSRRVIPWGEIDEMVWGRLRHCVFIKGSGRTLVFTSTDYFADLPALMAEIYQHSRCKLSSNLQGVFPEPRDSSSD